MTAALTVIALATTAAVISPQPALAQADAQTWPQRTFRFIVPFGPGSAADISARVVAERGQKTWGKPVIVENKPGGDGLVSIGAFVSAKDDHTLFLSPSTTFLVHPYTHENLPYNIDRDFRPISWITTTPIGVAVTATLPVKTLKDFVDHSKREGGKVNYGISGGFLEFIWDGFRRKNNVPMSKVPFRDIVQAPIDLGEGRISVLMTSVTTHGPMLRAGKTKLIAICDPERSDVAPGVPTVVESGYPELLTPSLNILFGPAHMPLQLRQRIANDIAAALKEKEVQVRLRAGGMQIVGAGPEKVAETLKEHHALVARVAEVLGVTKKK
jgi:tripartite-type tricarboxylate transporter receptor subunit TctC